MLNSPQTQGSASDLARFIDEAVLIDTHEHLEKEADFIANPPDVLYDLFGNYVRADLVVAGATEDAVSRLVDASNPDIRARFAPVERAWECCQYTGYGEAVRMIARHFYGMEEITLDALERAQESAGKYRRPGVRRELLEQAGIDHVQVDDFSWKCVPDPSGAEFFLYDLSWVNFCNGEIKPQDLHEETEIEIRDLESLRAALSALFAKYGHCAIAVKTQHAYSRTLHWKECSDTDAAAILAKVLAEQDVAEQERCLLGDWCLARGVELATEYNLPFKIHTGYYAGHSSMRVERIASGHLGGLLRRYPNTKFVLMHTAYPYCEELIALAKHFPNVWVDLCWAWSINPYATTDFVRRFLHAAPANKLFGFGGDSFNPLASVAYAMQARQGLTRALEAEIAEWLLTERQALALAEQFLTKNQSDCFDIEGTRQAIREAMAQAQPN